MALDDSEGLLAGHGVGASDGRTIRELMLDSREHAHDLVHDLGVVVALDLLHVGLSGQDRLEDSGGRQVVAAQPDLDLILGVIFPEGRGGLEKPVDGAAEDVRRTILWGQFATGLLLELVRHSFGGAGGLVLLHADEAEARGELVDLGLAGDALLGTLVLVLLDDSGRGGHGDSDRRRGGDRGRDEHLLRRDGTEDRTGRRLDHEILGATTHGAGLGGRALDLLCLVGGDLPGPGQGAGPEEVLGRGVLVIVHLHENNTRLLANPDHDTATDAPPVDREGSVAAREASGHAAVVLAINDPWLRKFELGVEHGVEPRVRLQDRALGGRKANHGGLDKGRNDHAVGVLVIPKQLGDAIAEVGGDRGDDRLDRHVMTP